MVRETPAWLAEDGWTSQAISSEATVHYRSQADQKRFLGHPIPVHVNCFSAWIDTMSGRPTVGSGSGQREALVGPNPHLQMTKIERMLVLGDLLASTMTTNRGPHHPKTRDQPD